MKTKIQKVIGILLLIVGFFFILLGGSKHSESEEKFSRPDNTYYFYNDIYDYFEIKTQEKIDVDNCFVTLNRTTYNDNSRVKLQYEEKKNEYYIFKVSVWYDFTITSVEIVDIEGKKIDITKYTEVQEIERLENIENDSSSTPFVFIGIIIIIVGVVLLVAKPKKQEKTSTISTDGLNTKTESKEQSIICEYCGTKNTSKNPKCRGCGASLK